MVASSNDLFARSLSFVSDCEGVITRIRKQQQHQQQSSSSIQSSSVANNRRNHDDDNDVDEKQANKDKFLHVPSDAPVPSVAYQELPPKPGAPRLIVSISERPLEGEALDDAGAAIRE
jgi:hypothetical protein